MSGIKAASVAPTPSVPDTTVGGDRVAAFVLYHYRLFLVRRDLDARLLG
jgi:hypothetical protein